ncbi:MAG: glycosyltransferase family 39 protein, partial [Bacteroidota bacterium]
MKFFRIENTFRLVMPILFMLKVISGIAMTLIYTYYYTDTDNSDLYKYYNDGKIIFSALSDNPLDYLRMVTGIDANSEHLRNYYLSMENWFKNFNYELYNDNRTIIRIHAVFHLFSFGSIYVHNILMSFLSFIGLTGIFKAVYSYVKEKNYALLAAVFLMPSLLFWSSGALKEGIVIFSFGMFFYYFCRLLENFKLKYFFGILIFVTILLASKFYVLLAALPGLVFLFWMKLQSGARNKLIIFAGIHIVFLMMVLFSRYIFFGYDFLAILSQKQHDFVNFVQSLTEVGSYIEIPELKP